MNKRKLLLVAIALCMAAILLAGGTLAYLTDTDDAINTFTVGKVKIELIEKERGENGLVDFTPDKKLFPIVGSAQGEKDKYGLPTAENFEDKIVTVKVLKGSENAYIRVLMAFPTAMDNDDASNMPLHWSAGNKFVAAGDKTDFDAENEDFNNWTMEGPIHKKVTIKDCPGTYNIYCFTYEVEMTAEDETDSACVVGFYLDARVDCDDTGYFMMIGENRVALSDAITDDGEIKIPVFAQGVQATGFDSAAEAFAASGLPTNPWAE